MSVPVSGKKFSGSESARTGINGLSIADEVTQLTERIEAFLALKQRVDPDGDDPRKIAAIGVRLTH